MVKVGDRVQHANDLEEGKTDFGTVLDTDEWRSRVRWDSGSTQNNVTGNLIPTGANVNFDTTDYSGYYEAITE